MEASDFPQEILNLFDGYVHGGISRRQFLDGAQKFGVGGVTAAALLQMLKPNYAWAIQVPPDDKRIKEETQTVPSPQGNGSIKGYLVRPADETKLPAVLVIHENPGLNPYIEDVARLAVADFIAFAPDALTSLGGYTGDDEGYLNSPHLRARGCAHNARARPSGRRIRLSAGRLRNSFPTPAMLGLIPPNKWHKSLPRSENLASASGPGQYMVWEIARGTGS
jgi:hypothetical protein